MKKTIFAMMAVATLLVGMTGCSKEDNPSTIDVSAMEQDLVGLWWDEFEYADVTETGVPFSRVLLAVKADADHTGCIYLGVFDDSSDDPLAVYGGAKDAAFTWHLLSDGRILLGDPVTGETYALSRRMSLALTRSGSNSSYGQDMTDVSSTSLSYSDEGVTVTNDDYSGTLAKASFEEAADIEEKLQTKINTNLSGGDALEIDDTPGSGWSR